MRATMSDLIQVLLPNLSPALAGPGAVSDILRITRALPPIGCGGFECRLADDDSQVDFSQCISTSIEDLAMLGEYIAGNPVFAGNPIWRCMSDFCARWPRSSFSLSDMWGIWLEIDEGDMAPSVILNLGQETPSSDSAYAAAKTALNILLQHRPLPWKDSLDRCFTTDLARVVYIGIMMARSMDDTVRVEFKPRSPESILPFLRHLGWSGQEDELEALIECLYSLVGHIGLVQIDIGAKAYSRIGLEFACHTSPDGDYAITALLGHLIEIGLCSPEKRDGLLAWPGHTDPASSQAPWPAHLIAESLLQPPETLSLIERRLSHIKVIYQPGQPLEAKGYLWFSHRWLQPEPETVNS